MSEYELHLQLSIVASPKCFDFKWATVLGLGHGLSKHKTARYARNLGVHGPLLASSYIYESTQLACVKHILHFILFFLKKLSLAFFACLRGRLKFQSLPTELSKHRTFRRNLVNDADWNLTKRNGFMEMPLPAFHGTAGVAQCGKSLGLTALCKYCKVWISSSRDTLSAPADMVHGSVGRVAWEPERVQSQLQPRLASTFYTTPAFFIDYLR